MTFTPTESGTYYARVSGDRDETGSYTLSLTDVTLQQAVLVPGPPEAEPESAQGQSTPGAGGRGNVSEPDDTDLPDDTTTTGEVDVGGSVRATSVLAATATGSAWSWRQARDTRSTWRARLRAAAL